MFNVDQEAPLETAAATQLTALIALITNPALAQKEFDRLTAVAARAREEVAAANGAKAAARQEAEVANKARTALADREVEIANQRNDLIQRQERITHQLADLGMREDQLKRRLLAQTGRELHPLQDLPSFESLERELSGRRSDAHINDHVDGGEFRVEEAPHQIPGSSLSRSVKTRPPRPHHADR
jgi:hypothetical protein